MRHCLKKTKRARDPGAKCSPRICGAVDLILSTQSTAELVDISSVVTNTPKYLKHLRHLNMWLHWPGMETLSEKQIMASGSSASSAIWWL